MTNRYLVTMTAVLKIEIDAPDSVAARKAIETAFHRNEPRDPLEGAPVNLPFGMSNARVMTTVCESLDSVEEVP